MRTNLSQVGTTRLQAQQDELTATRDTYDALVLDLEAAEQEAGQARAARDAAHQAHAAYALAENLRPGEPCPVCLQPVATLPGHAMPPGLDEVWAVAAAAEKKSSRVRAARDEAGHLVAAADAAVKITRGPRRGGGGGFGVIGGHPDGVGDLLDLGVQPGHVRGQLAERPPGRDGRRGVVRLVQFAVRPFVAKA